ncbi:EamA family transporter [Paenibacillus sp. y28]|uniref:EamA family transporter n=1 Tax=Paenibacillus sp. y28 TaxID=3129110 RepID=UPI0030182A36
MWLAFAMLAAVSFGFRGILYQWSSQKPMERNLMLFGVYLTGTIVSLAGTFVTGQHWSSGTLIGVFMGLFSFASNAAMVKGFAVGKASLVAVFTALPPVVVASAAFVIWGERLNVWQTMSLLIIVSGMVMIRYSSDLSLRNLQGLQWAVITLLGFAITDLSSKQAALWETDKFPTLFLMYLTGTVLFYGTWRRFKRREAPVQSEAALPDRAWSKRKTVGWGMFVGLTNICGMFLLLVALKDGMAGLVSAISAMNVLLILLYVRYFLKEKFRPLEAAGMWLAIGGIILLRLLG